jgi:hypothetical protein
MGISRKLVITDRKVVRDSEGRELTLFFRPPTSTAHRIMQRTRWRVEGGKVVADPSGALDALIPVALDSLTEVGDASLEAGDRSWCISSDLDVDALNKAAGSSFSSWKDVFGEAFPDAVRALAMHFYVLAGSYSGLTMPEEKAVERN